MRKNNYYPGKFNQAFYKLRATRGWSQEELGARLGYTRQYIAQVENGASAGKCEFWLAVQDMFGIPDSKMWSLVKGDSAEILSPPIHFVCDQKQCRNCKSDICNYTVDPTHAKNFEYDGYIGYWEKK